jgi:transcription termination factor Rho
VNKSSTRREELLIDPVELQRIWILRKLMHPMNDIEAIEFLLDRLKATKSNADFFTAMKR